MKKTEAAFAPLPRGQWPMITHRHLTRDEVEDRLETYYSLAGKFCEFSVKAESVQLNLDMDQRAEEESYIEATQNRISTRMNSAVSSLMKENSLRRMHKKSTIPLPQIDPRQINPTSTLQVRDILTRMIKEGEHILSVSFLPEEDFKDKVITGNGEDIPDIDEPRRPTQPKHNTQNGQNTQTSNTQQVTQTTNTQQVTQTTNTQQVPQGHEGSNRPTERPPLSVNFEDREQHRGTTLNEVHHILSIAGTNNRVNQASDRPAHPDTGNWQRNDQDRSSVSSDSNTSGRWDGNWAGLECTACGNRGHHQGHCDARRQNKLWCTRCRKNTHCDRTCTLLQHHPSSTPRYNNYHNNPSPRTNNYIPPVDPNYHTRPSPSPSHGDQIHDLTQMFVTQLVGNRNQAEKFEARKDLLANITLFDGKDKKLCLMWLKQAEQIAQGARITLKEVIMAKAGTTITHTLSTFLTGKPDATDDEIKQIILENFSNVGTKAEARHVLRTIRLQNDESLLTHNAEYTAIHEAAYGIPPEQQTDEDVMLDYATSLNEFTKEKLTRKDLLPQFLHPYPTRRTMREAETLYRQVRQEEVAKLSRSSTREMTISEDSINEVSMTDEVNYISPRGGDNRFNSTMKSNYNSYNNFGNRSNYSPRGRNNSYSSNRNWSLRNNYSNNFDSKRKLNRYRHQNRFPKKDVKFKYNAADSQMYNNLRRTINRLKDEPQETRNKFKRFPRFTNRSQEEVREDAIATITIEQIAETLAAPSDLVFDALVIGDYIDEENDT